MHNSILQSELLKQNHFIECLDFYAKLFKPKFYFAHSLCKLGNEIELGASFPNTKTYPFCARSIDLFELTDDHVVGLEQSLQIFVIRLVVVRIKWVLFNTLKNRINFRSIN